MLECGSLFLSLSETMLAVRFLVLMNRSRTNPFAPLLHRHSFVRSIAFVSDNFALSFFVFANYRNQWRKRVANISIMRIILQLKVCDGPVPCHCRKPKSQEETQTKETTTRTSATNIPEEMCSFQAREATYPKPRTRNPIGYPKPKKQCPA